MLDLMEKCISTINNGQLFFSKWAGKAPLIGLVPTVFKILLVVVQIGLYLLLLVPFALVCCFGGSALSDEFGKNMFILGLSTMVHLGFIGANVLTAGFFLYGWESMGCGKCCRDTLIEKKIPAEEVL